ncbi:uncharacterized protein BJ212DRAFT_1479652 [Suillus subaureus]|uniref:Uncharacterized protein n=1 Tax=Suillus subaureus TaxID=48587 RepID=A0A9P7JF67_9AGAM|nr:uncharacterized protein BJ212DRAFT_1479652 [Suillus subaureus]KAG1818659.1 hypothetical protein BJ212DRAFT_1479652 [Suillus subaureus]
MKNGRYPTLLKTRVGGISARVNSRFILRDQIAKGGVNQAPRSKVQTQEASCFPRVREQTESGTCLSPDLTLDIDKGSSHQGTQETPRSAVHCGKMRYRRSDSDSSHEIVAVPAPVARRHRHPRAPTTVQIVNDDFDAVTQDVDFETTSEMRGFDGITQVHVHKEEVEDAARYSGVYGEEYLYAEELARRVLDAGLNDQETVHSSDKRQQNAGTIKRHGSDARSKVMERGTKVSMWREDVARNDKDEFGNVVGNIAADAAQRTQEWRSKSPPVPRDIENLKSGLRRSRSSVSQTYRSERIYTPSDLNTNWSPQGKKAKRDKRGAPPSPTRSERIYTMAELNALSKHIRTSPLQPQPATFPQEPTPTRSSNSNSTSPPRSHPSRGWPSAPVMGVRSTSTSSVEMVLASCEPTLLHIAPVLASLGIRREEHLRAFARLREETRDREMKEEVLKKGVTVLEWAILMDKLQSF